MGHLGALSIFFLSLSFSVYCSEILNEYEERTTYIVKVQKDVKPLVFTDVEEWYKATLGSLIDSNPLSNTENSIPTQKDIIHVYKTVFHGFSAKLTPQQAKQLLNKPEVIAVLPDHLLQLHTTWSPTFLGLYSISSDNTNYNDINKAGRLLSESDSGADIIIGLLDSGIWPEHRSFKDDGLSPISSKWKGECVGGKGFECNNKIIGARFFSNGYKAAQEINSTEEINSARDFEGHGTHTASTAAGIATEQANLLGYANGTAVGVATKARIAVYKVCWKDGCMNSDILSGFDKAVEDGVDIISISIGSGRTAMYDLDPIALGAFGAMEKGIPVIASAGNRGPQKGSVSNVAPWMTSVGASTIDRGFPASLVLGDGQVINGMSLYNGKLLPKDVNYPLIYGGFCLSSSSLDDLDVHDKIVVCDQGGDSMLSDQEEAVREANGTGMVAANVMPMGEDLIAYAHMIPGLAITESARLTIREYIIQSTNPTATMVFYGTELGTKPAPVVASFSSRGPSLVSASVLKPDLIAPGVNILAAWPDGMGPTGLPSDSRQTKFNVLSGTSMSCPHVAGVAALLKGAHPDWSPAMIRSAMMTTAYTHDKRGNPILDDQASYKAESTAWVMGAGHVDPEKAVDPRLVYDISADDYLDFLCASGYNSADLISKITNSTSKSCDKKQSQPWDLNYPAISLELDASQTTDHEIVIKRTVTYVGDHGPATYSVTVTNPRSGKISVTVNPQKMEFNGKGDKKTYSVRIKATSAPVEDMDEGKIVWSDGQREVVSPVVVVWA